METNLNQHSRDLLPFQYECEENHLNKVLEANTRMVKGQGKMRGKKEHIYTWQKSNEQSSRHFRFQTEAKIQNIRWDDKAIRNQVMNAKVTDNWYLPQGRFSDMQKLRSLEYRTTIPADEHAAASDKVAVTWYQSLFYGESLKLKNRNSPTLVTTVTCQALNTHMKLPAPSELSH